MKTYMKRVVLSHPKFEAYGPVGGILFRNGIPVEVDDAIAARLLSSGRFAEIGLSIGVDGIPNGISAAIIAPARMPRNDLGADDLNGRSVLLRRYGAIGDLVFVAQFAALLKQRFPRVSITLGVREEHIPFVSLYGHIDRVIPLDLSCTADEIVKHDYVIPFNGVIEGRPQDDADYFLLHAARAGLPDVETVKSLPRCAISINPALHTEAVARAQKILIEIGFENDPYIVALLGTSNPLKSLHHRVLDEVCGRLARGEYGKTRLAPRRRVLCVGGPQDRCEIHADNPFVRVANHQDLITSALLIAGAKLIIGGDTGLLHFAASLGAPTASYWGATDAQLTMSRAPGMHRAVQSSEKCSPCRHLRPSFCEKYDGTYAQCMRSLSADTLLDAADELLAMGQPVPDDLVALAPMDMRAAPARILSPAEVVAQFDGRRYNIAVLFDHAGMYTGGGHYVWQLARALAERGGARIWMLLDSATPVYAQDCPLNAERSALVYDPQFSLLGEAGIKFNLVIGTPIHSGSRAVAYAQARAAEGVQSLCTIYETPNYIRKYRDGMDGKDEFWAEYKITLEQADHVITISQEVKQHLLEWIPSLKGHRQVETITPCTTSDLADTLFQDEPNARCSLFGRENIAVMIARNVLYKGLAEVLDVVCGEPFALKRFTPGHPFTLYVIGDGASKLKKHVQPWWEPNGVHVVLLDHCTEAEKWKLLRRARAVIHPSDFEGFGIPIAEAMYAGAPALAHPLPVFKECFADHPFYYTSTEKLLLTLKTIWSAWDELPSDAGKSGPRLREYLEDAWRYTMRRYTFQQFRNRLQTFIAGHLRDMVARVELADTAPRVAIITPWGNRCGVAETTREIARHLTCGTRIFAPTDAQADLVHPQDDANVHRCWERKFEHNLNLLNAIAEYRPNIVHFEHEFSLFRAGEHLFTLMDKLRALNIKVVVTLHTFLQCRFISDLAEHADAIIITKQQEDVRKSHVIGLPARSVLAPDRVAARAELELPGDAYVVGSYGMWNPHKGFREFLETYPDVMIRSEQHARYIISGYAPPKFMYHAECRRKFAPYIKNGYIKLYDQYDPFEKIIGRLAACDTLVFYYNVEGHSSASAAIRDGLAVGRPIICTNSPMFSEFADGGEVVKVPFLPAESGVCPQLVDAIALLRDDNELRASMVAAARKYAENNTPEKIAQRHEKLYNALLRGEAIGNE